MSIKNILAQSFYNHTPEQLKVVCSEIEAEILKGLPKKEDCSSPVGTPTQYVTQDMAIDAGDRSLEGSIFRDENWEQCGECINCISQQVIDEVIKAVKEACE
jgi:hypothetical protein